MDNARGTTARLANNADYLRVLRVIILYAPSHKVYWNRLDMDDSLELSMDKVDISGSGNQHLLSNMTFSSICH